jgi:hypothetical protein
MSRGTRPATTTRFLAHRVRIDASTEIDGLSRRVQTTVFDTTLAITAAALCIAYLLFVAGMVRLLVTRSIPHPVRLLATIGALVGALPPILYAFASTVTR